MVMIVRGSWFCDLVGEQRAGWVLDKDPPPSCVHHGDPIVIHLFRPGLWTLSLSLTFSLFLWPVFHKGRLCLGSDHAPKPQTRSSLKLHVSVCFSVARQSRAGRRGAQT